MEQEPTTLKIIGLISGTSVDGVDAALVEVRGEGPDAQISLEAYKCYPYPDRMREALFNAFRPEQSRTDNLCALNFVLGELFAAAATDLVKQAGLKLSDIDLIGSHGQTIWHSPEQMEIGGMWTVSTLQIGEPAVIAERTGVTTVADFRPADMAAGGQGAPLVPYADYVLFKSRTRSRAIQNIGGIENVTYITPRAKMSDVVAFDTGPGNMLIDAVVTRMTDGKKTFDKNGKLALAGKVDRVILGRLLKHPFLQKRPPKSTGREDFGLHFADALLAKNPEVPLEDMVATVTAFTAQSIVRSYERFFTNKPDDVILGGGGAWNPAIIKMLAEGMPRTKILKHEDFGFDSDAKEALAFALLAGETIRGRPSNLPSSTGAERSVVLGKIVPGRNYCALMNKLA